MRRRVAGGLLALGLAVQLSAAPASFGERYCGQDGFRCIRVAPGDRWETLFPDPAERGLVMRINRMNVEPRPGQRIAAAASPGSTAILDLAPFPRQIPALPADRLVIDQRELAWGAYDRSGGSHVGR